MTAWRWANTGTRSVAECRYDTRVGHVVHDPRTNDWLALLDGNVLGRDQTLQAAKDRVDTTAGHPAVQVETVRAALTQGDR